MIGRTQIEISNAELIKAMQAWADKKFTDKQQVFSLEKSSKYNNGSAGWMVTMDEVVPEARTGVPADLEPATTSEPPGVQS